MFQQQLQAEPLFVTLLATTDAIQYSINSLKDNEHFKKTFRGYKQVNKYVVK